MADGSRWSSYESDAREISRYVRARLRSALPGSARRWLVLSVVLLLHIILWLGLVELMARRVIPVSDSRGAIQVDFIVLPPPSAAPATELSPIRRRVPEPASQPPPRRGAAAAQGAMAASESQELITDEPGLRPRLFRPDGSPNISEDLLGDIERQMLADGLVEYRIADLERAGHFEVKPAMTYEATVFERYWVPSESLLEEWVRRGIKRVSIPIPGTNQHITCFISLVAPGAACGITPPRQMNEQVEADYVPPPNRNLRTD